MKLQQHPWRLLAVIILITIVFVLLACDPGCMNCGISETSFDPAPLPAAYYFRP